MACAIGAIGLTMALCNVSCKSAARPENAVSKLEPPPDSGSAEPSAAKPRSPPVSPSSLPSPSFESVQYGFGPSSCSPQFADGEPDGIKIAAPTTFHMKPGDEGQAKLPFCVSLQVKASFLEKFQHVFQALKVVVVDDSNGEVRSGGIWRDRHYLPRSPSKIPQEELEQRIAWKYSTVDLLEFFRLPPRKASYQVYAVLEQYKSNVITIQVEVD